MRAYKYKGKFLSDSFVFEKYKLDCYNLIWQNAEELERWFQDNEKEKKIFQNFPTLSDFELERSKVMEYLEKKAMLEIDKECFFSEKEGLIWGVIGYVLGAIVAYCIYLTGILLLIFAIDIIVLCMPYIVKWIIFKWRSFRIKDAKIESYLSIVQTHKYIIQHRQNKLSY